MIAIYHGDGKGKTTAAVGLSVRAAGHGLPVLFLQFLKDGSSGEIRLLQQLPGVETRHAPRNYGFSFRMTEAQKEDTRHMYLDMLAEAAKFAGGSFDVRPGFDAVEMTQEDMSVQKPEVLKTEAEEDANTDENGNPVVRRLLVLDEVLHAIRAGLLPEEKLLALMETLDCHTELVLTGQNPSAAVLSYADYITEMRKQRHPYDRGVLSRKGVEL